MHLLNRYALSCGVYIDEPFVNESYYPLAVDKYIVFQTSGKGNSRQYDYWTKVFAHIKEYTTDYKIIHVGIESDQPVNSVDMDLRGKTSLPQLAYLIKNSSLYLGIDSLSAHFAGHYNKKIVAMYPYCYAQNCKPFWGDPEYQTLLEVDWKTHGKPSFSLTEENKKINTFMPEVVAKAALDQLGVKNDLDKVKTLHIGAFYHKPMIEIVPDSLMAPAVIKDKICNIRMDYHYSETNLIRLASISFLNIITNKEIPINIIEAIKSKIHGITVIANDSITLEYLKDVKSLGIKIDLIAKDDENWGMLAEKFFDFGLEKDEAFDKKSVKAIDMIDETCLFSSEKIILSEEKVFASKLAWKNNQPKLDRLAKVVDDPVFWEELDHFHIIKDERFKHKTIQQADQS
jgi:ADP-heptose:LPS heptosyltransferase